MSVTDIPSDILGTLTDHARKVFDDPELELTDEYFDAVRGPFGTSLRNVLNNPEQGIGEVLWYMDFKAAGGYE